MSALPAPTVQRIPLASSPQGFALPVGLERILTQSGAGTPKAIAIPAGTAFVLIFTLEGSGQAEVQGRHIETLKNHVTLLQCNKQQAHWTPSRGFDGILITVGNLVFQSLFGKRIDVLRPYFQDIIEASDNAHTPSVLYRETLSLAQRATLTSMLNPPIVASVSELWYQAKSMELLVTLACRDKNSNNEKTLFCSYIKRQTQERVSIAKRYIKQHLDSPLDLQKISRIAGCSTTYLSRTFSAETGMTLRCYLRSVRIEAATRLMQSGRCNVSEAAIEVGYTSFSHFTRAFTEEKGITPSTFLKSL